MKNNIILIFCVLERGQFLLDDYKSLLMMKARKRLSLLLLVFQTTN